LRGGEWEGRGESNEGEKKSTVHDKDDSEKIEGPTGRRDQKNSRVQRFGNNWEKVSERQEMERTATGLGSSETDRAPGAWDPEVLNRGKIEKGGG